IPENKAGSLEGYLWPGRYDIYEDQTAEDVIAMMWGRMEEELTAREIPEDEWHRTLTVASLAELEVRRPEDYGKVVRTIENRLAGAGEADGTPMKLQFDSTVHYAAGKSGSVATTDEERASDSPYNTYRRTGLPPGPIAAPGAGALDAAVDPPEGDWLYFVSVNTETGETQFAATWAEHEQNDEEWQAWDAAYRWNSVASPWSAPRSVTRSHPSCTGPRTPRWMCAMRSTSGTRCPPAPSRRSCCTARAGS